jgi:HEAT repeat protein
MSLLCWVRRVLNSYDERRVRSLLAQLDSGGPRARRNADDALSEIYLRPFPRGIVRIGPDLARLDEEHYSRIRGTVSLVPLLDTLASGGENAKAYCAGVLSLIGDRRAVPLLVHAIRHDPPGVRAAAAGALGNFADPSTLHVLVQALDDEDPGTRRGAASALGRMKDSRAVAPLLQLLASKIPDDRQYAIWALGDIDDPSTLPTIRGHLRDKSNHVRKAAKRALGQFDLRRRQSKQ